MQPPYTQLTARVHLVRSEVTVRYIHIVTILTENHIFSCVCVCKAAYKQRIWQLLVNANAHMYPPYTQTAACVRWMQSEVTVRYI